MDHENIHHDSQCDYSHVEPGEALSEDVGRYAQSGDSVGDRVVVLPPPDMLDQPNGLRMSFFFFHRRGVHG